jgi:excisionase family DNA binding protein
MDIQPPTSGPSAPFLTIRELASRWRCSTETIKRRRRSGHIATYKLGGIVRFRLSDVVAYESMARL